MKYPSSILPALPVLLALLATLAACSGEGSGSDGVTVNGDV